MANPIIKRFRDGSDNENLRAFPEREKAGLKRFIDEGLQDGDVQPLTNVRHKYAQIDTGEKKYNCN